MLATQNHNVTVQASSGKQPLGAADLSYLGSFKMPQSAGTGPNASTGFSRGLLAFRRVGSSKRLFSDRHNYSQGEIYEVEIPALKTSSLNTAPLANYWGDIYQGQRLDQNGVSKVWPVNGLRWEESSQSLYWNYCESYNADNRGAPTIGRTVVGSVATAEGAWKIAGANQLWVRGGTLEIPQWFASQYCPGKTLGVGFGGYYSIFQGGSYGPTLVACEPLTAANKYPGTVASKVLLGYSYDPNLNTGHRCERFPDYYMTDQTPAGRWMGVDPAGGVGTWTAADYCGGWEYSSSGIWIDTPTKSGVVYFSNQGLGGITYTTGHTIAASLGTKNRGYFYSPADLALVAQGAKQAWEPSSVFTEWPTALNGTNYVPGIIGGLAFDPVDSILYMMVARGFHTQYENYPVVHAYGVVA